MTSRAYASELPDDGMLVACLTAEERRDPATVANLLAAMLDLDGFTSAELAGRAGLSVGAWRKRYTEDAVWKAVLHDVDALKTPRGRPTVVRALRPERRRAVEAALAKLRAMAKPQDRTVISAHPDLYRCADLASSVYDDHARPLSDKLQRILAADERWRRASEDCEQREAAGTHLVEAALKDALEYQRGRIDRCREAVLKECARFLDTRERASEDLTGMNGHPMADTLEEWLFEANMAAHAALILGGRRPAVKIARRAVMDDDRPSFLDGVRATIVEAVLVDVELAATDGPLAERWSRFARNLVDALALQAELCCEEEVAAGCRRLVEGGRCGTALESKLRTIAEGAQRRDDDDMIATEHALEDLAPAA